MRSRAKCFEFQASEHVQNLYKRPEIPAKAVVPAISISVTYRKHEEAEIRVRFSLANVGAEANHT